MILYGSRRAQADGEAWPSRPSTCQLVVTNFTPPPWWLGSKSSFSPTIHRIAHQCVNGLAACSIPLAEPSQGDLLRAVPQVTCVTGLRTRENFTLCSTFSKCLRRTRRRGGTTLWSFALRATVSAVYQLVKASFIMSLSGERIAFWQSIWSSVFPNEMPSVSPWVALSEVAVASVPWCCAASLFLSLARNIAWRQWYCPELVQTHQVSVWVSHQAHQAILRWVFFYGCHVFRATHCKAQLRNVWKDTCRCCSLYDPLIGIITSH